MTCAQSDETKIENRSFVTFSRTSAASARAANGLASRNHTHGNPAFLPGAHPPPVLVFVRFFLAILRMGTAPFSLVRILADGRFHSGERLGRVLGLSRAGIWNLIRRVEALGLRVFKVRGRGYRLAEALDLFESPALAARSKKIAPELCVEVLDQCPSTNTVLAQRAAAGAPHGTVLVCEHQSAGRGRRGNSWITEVGGSLAFSILWRFPRGAGALGGLSLAVAVGAAKALERLGTEGVEVKWPNDLYCAGRKLGGILIESSGDILGPSTVIVGSESTCVSARGRASGSVHRQRTSRATARRRRRVRPCSSSRSSPLPESSRGFHAKALRRFGRSGCNAMPGRAGKSPCCRPAGAWPKARSSGSRRTVRSCSPRSREYGVSTAVSFRSGRDDPRGRLRQFAAEMGPA